MPGENARTGTVLSWVILLLVMWIAYRVTIVPPPTVTDDTDDTDDTEDVSDKDNCLWVTEDGKRWLVCTFPGGSIKVDTTGVGSGGQ